MCTYRTEDGKCKKFSDDKTTSYCVDAPCEHEKLSNYDQIRNMSVEEMATLFYGIIHERDLHIMKALEEKGVDASLIELSPEIHIAYHKQWLEKEVLSDGSQKEF